METALRQWETRVAAGGYESIRIGPALALLGQMHLDAGSLEKARRYGERLLEYSRRPDPHEIRRDSYRFEAHTLLGQLALREERIDSAVQHLHAAATEEDRYEPGDTPPSLELARELLARGRRADVAGFLRNYSRWLKLGKEIVENWIAEIDSGNEPNIDERKLAALLAPRPVRWGMEREIRRRPVS